MLHTTWRDITERKRVEAALRESEERYRFLFYSSPDPAWIIDKQRFVECNQAAIDLLGYPDKDSLRNTHPSELSPEFQPDGESSFSKAERMMLIAREKGINRFEWVHRRRDQSDFFAEVTLSSLTLQARQILYCTWRDITERKRIEENLRVSESRYRRLHESMTDAFAQVDLNGKIVEANKAFESMLGYSQEELRQLSYRDLTPECWHAAETRIITEQVLTRGHSDVYEKEYRRKNDSIIPVELRTFLLADDAGQPSGMWAIVRDISERKQTLHALLQSEARFRLIFEASPDPLIIARAEGGGILAVNRAFVAGTGIPAEEVLGRTGLELNLWADLNERDEFLRLLREDGEVVNLETRFRVSNGEIRTGLTSACMIATNDGPCMLIGIRDITRQKQAENVLMEMDRMKSEFISTAAHELRTPLAVILGYTELLRSPEEFGEFGDEHKVEFLEEIYLKCETLSFIIDEMLDISRIESGLPIALDLQPHQPEAWLTKVIKRFEMQGPGHTFQLDLSGRQPETVTCDLHRISQVLENLLSNAIKYSPRGGTITVNGATVGDDYVISIADQGIGMTSEQASHVFDKFWRADASNTAIGGLGLGMSIARQIVENHGGRIWVESSPGVGTKVSFSLPLH
jgi:PAS domain S-box-containing protein